VTMKLLTLMTSLMTSLMTMTLARSGDDDVIESCHSDDVSDTQTFAVDSRRLRSVRVWHGLKVGRL